MMLIKLGSIEPDENGAIALFTRGHESGDPLASLGLAWCMQNGFLPTQDPTRADQLIDSVLKKATPGALLHFGWLFANGIFVPQSCIMAAKLWGQAGELGNKWAGAKAKELSLPPEIIQENELLSLMEQEPKPVVVQHPISIEVEWEIQRHQKALIQTDLKIMELLAEIKRLKQQVEQTSNNELQTELTTQEERLRLVVGDIDLIKGLLDNKVQKKKALQEFREHPNLFLFYNRFQSKLEAIFISAQAQQGGFTKTGLGGLGWAGMGISFFGGVMEGIPLFGSTAATVVKGVGGATQLLDKVRQGHRAHNISLLGPYETIGKQIEWAARDLTYRFAWQLRQIATPDDVIRIEEQNKESNEGFIWEGVKSGAEMLGRLALCRTPQHPAENLADFAALLICERLTELENKTLDYTKDLGPQFVAIIMTKGAVEDPEQKWYSWEKIKSKVNKSKAACSKWIGLSTVFTKTGEEWPMGDLFTRCGIYDKENDLHYAHAKGKPKPHIYGFCQGTKEEAIARGLCDPKEENNRSSLSNGTIHQVLDLTSQVKQLENEIHSHKRWDSVQEWHRRVERVEEENRQLKQLLSKLALHLNKKEFLPKEWEQLLPTKQRKEE